MKRIHYSDQPVIYDPTRAYPLSKGCFKPDGLWYSASTGDDGWVEWCKEADFRGEYLKHQHELIIDTSKILLITTSDQLHQLLVEYPTLSYAHYNAVLYSKRMRTVPTFDWAPLQKDYSGIEISPYLYQWRMPLCPIIGIKYPVPQEGVMWYYAWDCASGVIWDLTAVKEFKYITPSL